MCWCAIKKLLTHLETELFRLAYDHWQITFRQHLWLIWSLTFRQCDVISPFNDFCGFWSVAINTMDKLQFLVLISFSGTPLILHMVYRWWWWMDWGWYKSAAAASSNHWDCRYSGNTAWLWCSGAFRWQSDSFRRHCLLIVTSQSAGTLAAWHSSSCVQRINEVSSAWYTPLVSNSPARSVQPCIPLGSLSQVPPLLGLSLPVWSRMVCEFLRWWG